MTYWRAVLNEVLHKDDENYHFVYTDLGDNRKRRKELMSRRNGGCAGDATKQVYYLGEKYEGVYLTQREAECVAHMLQGCTIAESAKILNLSPRTVEFYVKNIKVKLNCRKKSELLECIRDSDFEIPEV
jgi:DNA-binding CsgD family transcriptional regulator